ncbi:MAG TPA: Gfo/Idh/MocA family oxidoreductase [Ktedonobacteraceae bacterium]|jgi:predicted dehydrogenase|nr:Gfo/Idh/MocA family oxidoreductase [Ktedonobacteraceae bacterium]
MSVSVQQTPLRVVIIGYGLAGSVFHAPLVASTPGMRVAAIVTSDPQRQQQVRRDYPDAALLSSAEEVWRDPARFDLVVIAAVNRAHVPLGIAALEAGLPVVVDKPLAVSVADAERLLAASRHSGKRLTVFQNRRWDGDFLTLRQLLTAGMLGKVVRYESRFERYRPTPKAQAWRESADPVDAGGLLYDLGSHLIDQALQLFGKPTSVYAELARSRPGAGVDDDTFVALRFGNGVHAHLWMNVVSRIPGQRFRVSGLQGTYEKWGLDPQEDALRTGMRPGDANWGHEPEEHWGQLSTEINGLHFAGRIETVSGAYEQYYALVRDALVTGAPLPVDPGDVVSVLDVLEAAQQSAREGRVVALA